MWVVRYLSNLFLFILNYFVSGTMETIIPVLHPTIEDMNNGLLEYVKAIESRGADKWGIAKVIPPASWSARPNDRQYRDYPVLHYNIPQPILSQSFEASEHEGVFFVCAERKKISHVSTFSSWRDFHSARVPNVVSEVEYWDGLLSLAPLYRADIPGSLFGSDVRGWHLCHIPSILWDAYGTSSLSIEGVITPSIFVGSAGSTFACHTEDSDLYSINYLHWGDPKHWIGVPPAWSPRVEHLLAKLYPEMFSICAGGMRHKIALIKPEILRAPYGIPCGSVSELL